MKKKLIFILTICFFLLSLSGCGARQRTIVFSDHLSDVAVTIDDKEYTLEDLAFYVAYQEYNVQTQASVYDNDDTNAFWNLHLNKAFLRIKSRDEAMNMAIHDIIFYEMANDIEVELSSDEQTYADLMMDDFWNDIGSDAQTKLGVSYETIQSQVRKMAVSQKYQQVYALINEKENDEYNMNGDAYKDLLSTHTVKINKDTWESLSFGHITVNN